MTDYMRKGVNATDPDPLEESPFDPRIRRIKNKREVDQQLLLENAEKILHAAKSEPIATDENVIRAMSVPSELMTREGVYYSIVAPLAATCEELEWRSAYRIDVDAAPEPGTDEWRKAASELEIPDTRSHENTPQFVTGAYAIVDTRSNCSL